MARWKPSSVRKTNNRDSVKIFDHPRTETNVAAGGEKSKDRTPKSSAKKATIGLDMPANRYEALQIDMKRCKSTLPQIDVPAPSESAAAERSEDGAEETKEAGVGVAEMLEASRLEVLVCVVACGKRYGTFVAERHHDKH